MAVLQRDLEDDTIPNGASTGETGGFDFGLTHFLTDQTGHRSMSPEFFKQGLARVKARSRAVSRKVPSSRNRKKAD